MPASLPLRYCANPQQAPARVFMESDADLPIVVLNGSPGYINLLDGLNAWQLVRELNPKLVGACFDIGHATLEGGYSWPSTARLMEPHLAAVFVKDFAWKKGEKGWKAEWCPLGEGMVNKSFFAWLKKTGFTGPISQHHEYDHGEGKPMIAKMQQDLRVLREWLA